MTHTTSFSETKRQEVSNVWRYAGELEKLHGKKEAREFIRQGKYLKGEDSDGTTMYKKRTVGDSQSTEFTKKSTVDKSRSIDDDKEAGEVSQLMLEQFNASDFLGIVVQTPDTPKKGKGDGGKSTAAIQDGKVNSDDGDDSDDGDAEPGKMSSWPRPSRQDSKRSRAWKNKWWY